MGSGMFKYDAKTNTDGSISYTYQSLHNEPVRAHFDRFKNYLTGDDAYRAQFDTSGVANMEHILS